MCNNIYYCYYYLVIVILCKQRFIVGEVSLLLRNPRALRQRDGHRMARFPKPAAEDCRPHDPVWYPQISGHSCCSRASRLLCGHDSPVVERTGHECGIASFISCCTGCLGLELSAQESGGSLPPLQTGWVGGCPLGSASARPFLCPGHGPSVPGKEGALNPQMWCTSEGFFSS